MKKLFPLFAILVFSITAHAQDGEVYHSETLAIYRVSPHAWVHVTSMEAGEWGRVSANGLIAATAGEAVVFDTPPDEAVSRELIDWITDTLGCRIVAVVPTHYHLDNLGGLDAFHRRGIPSHANRATIEMAERLGLPVPRYGFDDLLELTVGDRRVYALYFGEGHTRDNIVGWFPSEKVLFGGCLVKEVGAGRGNLAEANPDAWPATVRLLRDEMSESRIVVPGHGLWGGMELLDYTIGLFE